MELGGLSISSSIIQPIPGYKSSRTFAERQAVLDRLKADDNSQGTFQRCAKQSSRYKGKTKTYVMLLPSHQQRSCETSGVTFCSLRQAEQKRQGKRMPWTGGCKPPQFLAWESHEAGTVACPGIDPCGTIGQNHSALRRLSSSWASSSDVNIPTQRSKTYKTGAYSNSFYLGSTKAYSNSSNLGSEDLSEVKLKQNRRVCTSAVALETVVKTSASPLSFSDSESPAEGGGNKDRVSKRRSSGASSVSSGVKLEHVSKTFKGETVLKDVTWDVKKGERVGLVGVNGAGKTTQLKIIVGEEEPDSGNVVKAKEDMRIAFLTQEFEVVPSRTVREEFTSAFAEQMNIANRLEKVQNALESSTDDLNLMGKLLDELDVLQRQAQAADLYDVDVKINKMMPELGFTQEDSDRLVASFSGGWQMRMSLGKILLQDPDLLLLDEPTNHLDLDTIEWLENYLKRQDVPMVIVSHDRAFLDQLCTKIVETDMGVSQTFEGNYSEYVQAKAARAEALRLAWEKQQKEIARTKDIIQRLSAGANAGRATTAEKQLEKIQEEQQVEKPFEHKPIKFRFPELERSGRIVVVVKNMSLQYERKVLFERADLLVEKGEKLAIIGPNGCGKSTLLRMIMGFEEPTSGEVYLGEHRVVANYFEQNQAEALDLEKTVLQTIEKAAEDWNLNDIRGLLGRCNFKADMVHRKVAFLSGGEKARLALCKFMVTPSTLLVLDEPTNHLDIPSKEMLEEAIREYTGTVIAVSHDRYFLRQIVNRVVEVKDNKLQDYAGDYNYYLEQNLEARRRELEREAELEAKAPVVKAKSKMSKAEKELQKKQKANAFQQGKAKGKVTKNAKRWN